LEQILFQSLDTWRALDSQRRKLHFWRNRAGHEVDFILEEAGKLLALEINAGSQVSTNDVKGIRVPSRLETQSITRPGGVVLHDGNTRALDANDIARPWGWMVPQIAVNCDPSAIFRKERRCPASSRELPRLSSMGMSPIRYC
jgi:hypothetical protein